MMNLFGRFARNESGPTAIEYGVLAALIGVGIIIAANQLGAEMGTEFARVSGTWTSSVSSAGSGY